MHIKNRKVKITVRRKVNQRYYIKNSNIVYIFFNDSVIGELAKIENKKLIEPATRNTSNSNNKEHHRIT